MKKLSAILAMLMSLIFVFAFSACTTSETPDPSASADTAVSADPNDTNAPDTTGDVVDPSAGSTAEATPRPTFDPNGEIDQTTPEEALTVSVESATVSAGETFTVDILFDDEPGWTWCSFEFVVNFDASKLRMTDAVATDLLGNAMFYPNVEYGEGQGKIVMASGTDLTGSGAVCTLEFEALEAGTSEITLTEGMVFRFVTSGESFSTLPVEIALEAGTITIQ